MSSTVIFIRTNLSKVLNLTLLGTSILLPTAPVHFAQTLDAVINGLSDNDGHQWLTQDMWFYDYHFKTSMQMLFLTYFLQPVQLAHIQYDSPTSINYWKLPTWVVYHQFKLNVSSPSLWHCTPCGSQQEILSTHPSTGEPQALLDDSNTPSFWISLRILSASALFASRGHLDVCLSLVSILLYLFSLSVIMHRRIAETSCGFWRCDLHYWLSH